MAYQYPFFQVEKQPEARTATLWLKRPDRKNAMNGDFWRDFDAVIADLEADAEVKAVVIAGRGDCFSAGLDVKAFFIDMGPLIMEKSAESREKLYHWVRHFQSGFRRMSYGQKIYIAAVHSHCIGAGLDLIAACDLRLAASNAMVSLRETKVAIVADLGSLQLLPGIIGDGNARLMAYTGKDFDAQSCQTMGLFSEIHPSPEALFEAAQKLAADIAANSGITLRGVKRTFSYGHDHGPHDGFDFVAALNVGVLDSADLAEAVGAFMEKRAPKFN